MIYSDADLYIAKILGGSDDTDITTEARDALKSAMERLTLMHNWSFLLQDTSQTETIAVSAQGGADVQLDTTVPNGFKNLLVGQTISGTNVGEDATIASIDDDLLGLVMSVISTGAVSGNVVFGGTIPVIAGQNIYKLPTAFWKPYNCRLLTNSKRPLYFIHHSLFDQITYDITVEGLPVNYTIYNAAEFDASGTQQTFLKLFRTPSSDDTILLKYYRPFNSAGADGDSVDVDDQYLYMVLDFASVLLLQRKNSHDSRLPALLMDARAIIKAAIAADTNIGGEDEFEGFKAPGDSALGSGFSGDFWPRGDHGGGFFV